MHADCDRRVRERPPLALGEQAVVAVAERLGKVDDVDRALAVGLGEPQVGEIGALGLEVAVEDARQLGLGELDEPNALAGVVVLPVRERGVGFGVAQPQV